MGLASKDKLTPVSRIYQAQPAACNLNGQVNDHSSEPFMMFQIDSR